MSQENNDTAGLGRFVTRTKVPTNPTYDFQVNPQSQHEYVNPVTANNKLVEIANAYLDLTSIVVECLQARKDLKATVAEAQQGLDDLELDVLQHEPPTATADTRNNRTIQAYVQRCLATRDTRADYDRYQVTLRDARRKLDHVEAKLEAARAMLAALEMQSTNIQTHLSFVKNEARNARHYT